MPFSSFLALANFAAKGFLVLGIFAVAAYLLRRRSAATIHRVWTFGFVALLVAPAAGLLLPQREFNVVPPLAESALPLQVRQQSIGVDATNLAVAGAAANRLEAAPERVSADRVAPAMKVDVPQVDASSRGQSVSTPEADAAKNRRPSLSRAVAIAWMMIAAFFLARIAIHQAVLARLLRRCTPVVDEPWSRSISDAARRLGLSRPVRLVTHAEAATPATAGSWRPVILLPADAAEWTASQRQSVLLHELAHVKRWDILTQTVAGVVCAIHWFNPLAWFALAQMRKLRELACDDLVLASGQASSDYADALLHVARAYRPRRLATTIGMARGTSVERRILAILDTAQNRLPISRRAATVLLAVTAATVVSISSIRLGSQSASADESPKSDAEITATASKASAAEASSAEKALPQDPDERTLEVLVTDEGGKPLPGARVYFGIWEVEGGKDYPSKSFKVDENGVVQIPIPRRLRILRLWPAHSGYVPEFVNFAEGTHGDGEHIPQRLHFKLAGGTKLSGRLVDETGQPIAGAKVEVRVEIDEPAWIRNPDPMVSTWLTDADFNSPAPVTDADGRWSIDNAPAAAGEKDYDFRLKITHDAYARDSEWGELQRAQGVTTAMLRSGEVTMVLTRGVTAAGTVVDAAGKPVTKGLVVWSDDPYLAEGVNETEIDADGRFETIPLKPGEYPVTVLAPGFQPVQQKVQVEAGMSSLRFELPRGKKLVMNIVDPQGKPVPNAYVGIGIWRGTEAIYNNKHSNVPDSGIPRTADKSGVYTWDWAPDDAVTYNISAKGFAEQEASLVAKGTAHVVTLPHERIATGTVTDAQTGEPIARFQAMPVIVFRENFFYTRHEDSKVGRDGKYEVPLVGGGDPSYHYRVRFEADGYRSLVSDESFGPLDGRSTLNVSLEPAPSRTGQVVDADGQPVANALVLEASPTDVPDTSNGEPESYGSRPLRTDAQGQFKFHATKESVLVRALHDRGFAEVRREPGEPIGTLKLQPWAKIEGRLVQGGQPVSGQLILFTPAVTGDFGEPRFQDSYQVHSDASGNFALERVPPVTGSVRAFLGPWRESPLSSSESEPLTLHPGERRTIVLGGEGADITGNVVPTGRGDVPLDAHWSLNYLVSRDRGVAMPAGFPALGFTPADGAPLVPEWLDDPNFQTWQATRSNYFVKLTPEGKLRISGVPVGAYDLVIQLYEQPAGCLVQSIGRKVVPIEVTEADIAAGGKLMGDIEVPCSVGPRVGEDMQIVKFLDVDGRERAISDMKGRFVLMHVWASWCQPCIASLPDIKAAVDELPSDSIAFVGLNIDEDADGARAFAEAKGLGWAQTYLGNESAVARQLAVSAAPAYFLIDRNGKLVSSSGEWQEMKQAIDASLEELRK